MIFTARFDFPQGNEAECVEAGQAARLDWWGYECVTFGSTSATFWCSYNALKAWHYLIMPPLIGVIGVPVLLYKLL